MNRSKNHKGILSDAVLLWGMPNDSKVKFCEYLKFPVTKLEVAKSYLRIFMSLRQVYERLFKIKSDPTLFMVNAKELQKIETIKLCKNEILINCQQTVDDRLVSRYILDDSVYFILIELDKQVDNRAKIIRKIRIVDLTAELEEDKPRKLNLIFKNPNNNQVEEINLTMEDKEVCVYIKERINNYSAKIIELQVKNVMRCLKNEII